MIRTSEQINEFAKALAAAQGAFTASKRGGLNQHINSKYSTLEDVIESCRPALSKHELATFQTVATSDNTITVTTRVIHSTGQWMEADASIPIVAGKFSPAHATGSAITYARRYCLALALGIVTDMDDDGNAASETASDPTHHVIPRQIPAKPAASAEVPDEKKEITPEWASAIATRRKELGEPPLDTSKWNMKQAREENTRLKDLKKLRESSDDPFAEIPAAA